MWETFLILIAGGMALPGTNRPASRGRLVLVGAAILAVASLTICVIRPEPVALSLMLRRVQWGLLIVTVALIAVQCISFPRWQRTLGSAVFVVAILAGSNLLHEHMTVVGTAIAFPPKLFSMILQLGACAGIAVISGNAIALFFDNIPRNHRPLVNFLVARIVLSVGVTMALQAWQPVDHLWDRFGWMIAARWVLGLFLPAALMYRGRGAALVAALMIAGEATGLWLVRATGLPF